MFGFYGRCIAIRCGDEKISSLLLCTYTAKVIQLHSLETGDLFCCVQLASGAEGAQENPEVNHYGIAHARTPMNQSPAVTRDKLDGAAKKGEKRT
jgi:hypothetical protein